MIADGYGASYWRTAFGFEITMTRWECAAAEIVATK
jgi:hypothetical protein